MKRKSFIILMAVLMGICVPSFNCLAGPYSTTVRYSSPGSSYYELMVPMVMAPGETANVSAVGTWNSTTALQVTSDEKVTLVCEEDADEMELDIFFDGIYEFGDESNETNVTSEISVEDVDKSVIGTWEGTFDYNVALIENAVSQIEHSGIIPEGGMYYVSATPGEGVENRGDYSKATAVYEPGDAFPTEINSGDIYVFGDYEYRYQCGYEGEWYNDYRNSKWGVSVVDDSKTSYGKILHRINGQAVDNLTGIFYGCSNMEKSPALPPEGILMVCSFSGCTALKEAPEIPENVSMLLNAFAYCSSLEKAPTIPAAAENLDNAFEGCTSLSGSIEINSVYIMSYMQMLKGTNISEVTGTISDEYKAKILATK